MPPGDRGGVAIALTLIAHAACGGAPLQRSFTVQDSAGVRIVTHESLVPTSSLEITSEPRTWIQGDERIAPFDRITAVALLSDTTVVIADRGAGQIHAFTPDGAYRWTSGGLGEGPGEFRGIGPLLVTAGDSVIVVDTRVGRVSLLAPSGEFHRGARMARSAGRPIGALLADGKLLYQREADLPDARGGLRQREATWSAVDLSGSSIHTLLTTLGREFLVAGMFVLDLSFMRDVYVAAGREGFLLSLSDRSQVDGYDVGGRWVSSLRFPSTTQPLDARVVKEDFLRDLPEDMRGAIGEALDRARIPERWPSIGDLIVDDVERVWVQAFRPDRTQEVRWHVFDGDGTYVDEVVGPAGFTPHLIRHGILVGVWRDDFDVQSVRMYEIIGP